MFQFYQKNETRLTADDRAAAINLAFLLDVYGYDKQILKYISEILSEGEKRTLCAFWGSLTEVTARAALCLKEFEGRL